MQQLPALPLLAHLDGSFLCEHPKPSKTEKARTPTIIRSGREREKAAGSGIGQSNVVCTFCVAVVVHEVG